MQIQNNSYFNQLGTEAFPQDSPIGLKLRLLPEAQLPLVLKYYSSSTGTWAFVIATSLLPSPIAAQHFPVEVRMESWLYFSNQSTVNGWIRA